MTDTSSETQEPAQASPSPRARRSRFVVIGLAVVTAAVVTSIILAIGVVTLLAATESSSDGRSALPASGTTGASVDTSVPIQPPPVVQGAPPALADTTTTTTTTTEKAPSLDNKEAKEAPKKKVEVGQCIGDLGGPEIAPVSCGSAESRYQVVGKGQCPGDTDSTHRVGEETLCLDIDWVVGSCMSLDGDHPTRIACAPGAVRVLSVLRNTVSVETCPSADRGFVYDERKFVVCFANQ
ncbi:LppU/SCO3897 family protein [Nocardia brevicatena]|uniref:LppU/SCO3897 family protein n=1 Tax=Nocardia brevicatena TaxID=37327 RepID=UPI0002DBBE38|nr:hypothetical protein [Nocardia brevicatena]